MAEYSVSNATPGSTTIGYRLRQSGATGARVTTGIVETPANSGVFVASIATVPPFTIIWDDNNAVFASSDIFVSPSNSSSVTVVAAVVGGVISVYRGTTWSINLIVGSITGYSKLWFTVKKDVADPDSASVVQIEVAAGLLVLNGSASVTAGDGVITVNNSATGDITVSLKPSSSSQLNPVSNINYDVKALVGTTVSVMADGRTAFNILGDVTRHVA